MQERNDNIAFGDPDFEQAVRDAAYFLWEHDGRPAGREQDYWYRALEQTLRRRHSDAELQAAPPPPQVGQ